MIAPRIMEKTYVNEAAKRKALLSVQEIDDLSPSPLRCPHCGFFIATLFSDAYTGHMKAKCPKCKTETLYSMAYFRRGKKYYRYGIVDN